MQSARKAQSYGSAREYRLRGCDRQAKLDLPVPAATIGAMSSCRRTVGMWSLVLTLAVLGLAGAGCGLVRPYRCTSDLEQGAFNRAARNIYPDDVRTTPDGYIDRVVVAWVGLITESHYSEREEDFEVAMVIEHHHFDWLEDFKLGENIYILSPRGEGRFRVVWHMRKDFGLDEVKRWCARGNMAVVYGTPASVDWGLIEIEAYCVRLVMRRRYQLSDYPYGRGVGWQY